MVNNNRYIFNLKNYKVKETKDKIILISQFEFSILVLNKTGYAILSLMDGRRTVNEIIELLKQRYDIKNSFIQDYSIKFIQKMVSGKLLKTDSQDEKAACKHQNLNRVYIDLNKGELSYEQVCLIVEEIEKNEHEKPIRFFVKSNGKNTDGEIKKILKYIGRKEFVKLFFFTEENYFNQEFLSEFKGMIDSMVLQLSSYEKAKDLERIVEKINLCSSNNMNFFVNIVLNDDNIESCALLQQDMNDSGVKGMFIDDTKVTQMENYQKMLENLYYKNRFLNSWRNNRLRDNSQKFYLLTEKELCLKSIYPHRYKYHCGIGIEEISIDSQGHIYPCHLAGKEGFYFNDIKDYYDKRIDMFGQRIKAEECKVCDSWCLCMGGCKMKNKQSGKSICEISPQCEIMAESIEKYYAKL